MAFKEKNLPLFQKNLEVLRQKIEKGERGKPPSLKKVLDWIGQKRKESQAKTSLVSLSSLTDWIYDKKRGIIHHKKGKNHFFSIEGITVEKALGREVAGWNQPIMVQKEGGVLIILCQERKGKIHFLLQAKFEPGNIAGVQLAPTIQATQSNLKRHHQGGKPRFSEYISHKKTKIIYWALHNEEGSRFFKKSNINSLILLDPKISLKLNKNDNYLWLTLSQIKHLMLYDNLVNPFVKTILSVI